MTITAPPLVSRHDAVPRFADLVMLCGLGLAFLAAMAVGIVGDSAPTAALIAGVPAAAGALVFAVARGTLLSRSVLLFGLCACVAAQIHLGYGQLEFHFGVFVALAMLLVYRDWRVVVAGATVFAVHHIVFDRLQAAGFAIYCTTHANFERILLHAAYVVIQTVLEVFIAVGLARLTRQGEELEALCRVVVSDDKVSLDLARHTVTSASARALKEAIGRIGQAMSMVRSSVDGVQRVGSEINDGTADLSTRTDQAALHLQQTTTLLAELTKSVLQSADATREADALATKAAHVAERGGSVVAQVVTTMDDINSSSRRIAEIIGVIDGIAFQTNILALNAAVEAARAGEQGRGFAVVAAEVRNLARRSADAAKEIKGLIGTSVERVASGARLVGEAGHTMSDIVDSVNSVCAIIGRVAATSAGQTRGIDQANASIAELDGMTRQNAALVEQSTASAALLRREAETMAGVVAAFDLASA